MRTSSQIYQILVRKCLLNFSFLNTFSACATGSRFTYIIQDIYCAFSVPYVMGSTKSLVIDYVIENAGETAYITQLNISISRSVTFMRIPSSCRDMNGDLLCDINSGSPLTTGSMANFKLTFDTTKVSGTHFSVIAHVFSTGDELNDADNKIEDLIALTEFSDIEIIG